MEVGREETEESGKGTWKHAAFHVATTIATPAAYAPLPFALASLGWPLGVTSLVSATLATWYSSFLIASLWKWNGEKYLTYRHLAHSIFGFWGYWSIAFFQQVASLGNNIAIQIAAGSSLKAVYKHYHENGALTLQHFIIFFGIFELLLSQFPDIHSLRWVNALCTFSTIGFAGTTIGVTIYNGKKIDRTSVRYSLQGSSASKSFNALGTIAFSFGDAMLPEIQNTVREPAKRNMYKIYRHCFDLLASGLLWILGFRIRSPTLYFSFIVYPRMDCGYGKFICSDSNIWMLSGADKHASFLNLMTQIYCRPTYACFEETRGSKSNKSTSHFPFPLRNRPAQLIFTSIFMVLVTLIAAAMPFFGDFVSICGAIGFTPLDFVFPVLAYLKAGRTANNSKLGLLMRPLNILIATWFSIVAILGCIGAVRFIMADIKNYNFFHDM
ncbi:hypothetical protein JHK85_004267 [Glycine max]|nr:hypothetical protein JHK85_004267 [Glycine max]